MITIPFFADHRYNADSLAAVEVGCTVCPGSDLVSRLKDALDAVLTEEPPGCTRMADAVASRPDISAAISLLELHSRPWRPPAEREVEPAGRQATSASWLRT